MAHHGLARLPIEDRIMSVSEQITIAPHLVFDVITAGASGAPLVLLLHGFAESMHCWRAQVAALGDMGYRAIAPSQRGYSPGARPDPREFSHYLIDRLMDDAMAIAAAAGYGSARFHLAGHDWGGSIAWGLADRVAHYPLAPASERVQSRVGSGWRTGAALEASQGVSGTGCRRCRARE
jgi:pimeloyl-ACP methyl ester carboxylesterase